MAWLLQIIFQNDKCHWSIFAQCGIEYLTLEMWKIIPGDWSCGEVVSLAHVELHTGTVTSSEWLVSSTQWLPCPHPSSCPYASVWPVLCSLKLMGKSKENKSAFPHWLLSGTQVRILPSRGEASRLASSACRALIGLVGSAQSPVEKGSLFTVLQNSLSFWNVWSL